AATIGQVASIGPIADRNEDAVETGIGSRLANDGPSTITLGERIAGRRILESALDAFGLPAHASSGSFHCHASISMDRGRGADGRAIGHQWRSRQRRPPTGT